MASFLADGGLFLSATGAATILPMQSEAAARREVKNRGQILLKFIKQKRRSASVFSTR
jgi:membrane protein YqaA with SNARE-associated domain